MLCRDIDLRKSFCEFQAAWRTAGNASWESECSLDLEFSAPIFSSCFLTPLLKACGCSQELQLFSFRSFAYQPFCSREHRHLRVQLLQKFSPLPERWLQWPVHRWSSTTFHLQKILCRNSSDHEWPFHSEQEQHKAHRLKVHPKDTSQLILLQVFDFLSILFISKPTIFPFIWPFLLALPQCSLSQLPCRANSKLEVLDQLEAVVAAD